MRYRPPPRRLAQQKEIDIMCHRHWDLVEDSRSRWNPINGTALVEFLLRRFILDIEKDPVFLKDLAGGMHPDHAQQKALANLAPICCLYSDDSMQELREACRYDRIAISHPRMNDDDDPEGKFHHIQNGRLKLQ